MKRMMTVVLLAAILSAQCAHAQFGKLKSNVEKTKNAAFQAQDAAEKAKDVKEQVDGASSEVNKKMGKVNIYFSKAPFKGSTRDAAKDFSEGDNIYGHIVFPKPIREYATDNTLTFDVAYKRGGDDNYSVNYVKIDVTKINQDVKELDFDVLAKPSEATTLFADRMQAPSLIAMVMQISEPGTKTEFNWKIEGLQGNFYLTIKNAKSFAAFVTPIQQKANGFAQNDDAMKAELPEELNQKSYAFTDPQLSKADIIKFLPANIEVLKFVIGPGDDYKVMKNELGIVLYKQTARYILVAYKDKKNGNCYYDNVIFERPYEGDGKYGSLKVRTNGERIDCNKIK